MGPGSGDEIAVLGTVDSSDPEAAVVIDLRHQDHPDWVVTFVFGPDGPAALTIKPYVPPLPGRMHEAGKVTALGENPPVVTARLLRRLPIGELESWARGYLAAEAENRADSTLAILRQGGLVQWFGDDNRIDGKRGRAHSDRAFAHLAAAYVQNHLAGGTLADLAEAEGWSESTIRNRLTQARKRELLTQPPKGKAGGNLTEKARQLLQEEN